MVIVIKVSYKFSQAISQEPSNYDLGTFLWSLVCSFWKPIIIISTWWFCKGKGTRYGNVSGTEKLPNTDLPPFLSPWLSQESLGMANLPKLLLEILKVEE